MENITIDGKEIKVKKIELKPLCEEDLINVPGRGIANMVCRYVCKICGETGPWGTKIIDARRTWLSHKAETMHAEVLVETEFL